MSKTKGVTVDRRESSELSVSLASEDEHRGVRSAIAASGELAAKHVVRSKPPLRMKRSAMNGAIFDCTGGKRVSQSEAITSGLLYAL